MLIAVKFLLENPNLSTNLTAFPDLSTATKPSGSVTSSPPSVCWNEPMACACQILNKKLLSDRETEIFSINKLWKNLIEKKELYGYETNNDFYHLTDIETFKKLQDL